MRHKFGDVVLAEVQFTDTFEIKTRPALILFEEQGNIVVMGMTSNLDMDGVRISRKEGAMKDSVIKLNYIFTLSEKMVKKFLFSISNEKKNAVKLELIKRIN